MKILILGGGGFLGLNFAEALNKSGHKLHLVDRDFKRVCSLPLINQVAGVHEIDCQSIDSILSIIDEHQIDCVINLVSILLPASPIEAFGSELREMMVPGFGLLNELAHRGIKYIYLSSGGAVYGQSESVLVREDAPKNPISLYGLSKEIFEQCIAFVSRTSGLNYIVLRPSNPYGAFQNPNKKQGLIAVVADKILKGSVIEIWGDGSIVRDYIWVQDLANAVDLLLQRNIWNETFNVGSGVGHSVSEIIKTVEDITGIAARCVSKEGRSADVGRIVLDVSKLKKAIQFEPTMLREGITKYVQELHLAGT